MYAASVYREFLKGVFMIGKGIAVLSFLFAACFILLLGESQAVTSYSRRYNVSCSACHSTWGSLNGGGLSFRMSGYRAIYGKELKPVEPDIDLAGGSLSIPKTSPLSILTGVGADLRRERLEASSGQNASRTGSTLALTDASVFISSPVGKHLSAFIEFPMYYNEAWEYTPTGPAEANHITAKRDIKFKSEKEVFEVAKFWWNNLIPGTPRDSVNLLFGISHPPLASSSGKVRLSVNQYLLYERRALDLISPKIVTPDHSESILSEEQNGYLFRLSKPQVFFEVNGMLVPGKDVTDTSKRDTLWMEYHLGISNGSNDHNDNNNSKDVYARLVARYFNQSFGIFAYHSSDTYDDTLRSDLFIGNGGILSGQWNHNSLLRIGPDMTLNLVPLGIPVSINNQYMYNRESDPTGFGKEFKWHGGYHQFNWRISNKVVLYDRYDWIKGNRYDDTTSTVLGVPGITKAEPWEWAVVSGIQYPLSQNLKLIGEYRHHEFEDRAGTPNKARLEDDGFTARALIAF
jgi:hypothetical protein